MHSVQLTLDLLQRKETFAQRKRQRRTDLQNSNAVFYHLTQALTRLIVRRMPLKDKTGMAAQRRHQFCGRRALVFDHTLIGKLNARLNNNGNDALPCIRQAARSKGTFKLRKRLLTVMRRCNSDAILIFLCAAGNGNLAANDVDRLRCVRMCCLILCKCGFCHAAKLCSAPCNRTIRQPCVLIVTCNTHTGVNMYFCKASQHIAANQFFRISHRFIFREILPRQRAKMVTAAQNTLSWHAFFGCQTVKKRAEIRRCHARVATVLVDLIRCGLDQHDCIVLLCAAQGGADHILVGTAAGVDAFFFCGVSFV